MLNNRTYGSENDPLFDRFVQISPRAGTTTYNQGGNTAGYDTAADGQALNGRGWIEYFSHSGGNFGTGNHAYDAAVVYNATITYADGTTAEVTASLFQDWNGQTFWAPESSASQDSVADQAAMEANPIVSLTTHGVVSTDQALGANRNVWDYVVCFTVGTLIETADRTKPVETLQSGDMVRTRDNGLQPIRWIGSRKLSAEELAAAPNLRPIRINAGALGANTPASDLVVSPQHRILIRSKIAQRMFGTDEVLVAAKQLLGIEGIEIATDIHDVEYFHFMFDCHEIVFSNGAEAESLFTGPVALRSVSPESRKEILSLFPELAEEGSEPQPARLLTSGRQGRRLAYRHARNQQEMVY
ncbi:Hint domain-containing protein [Paracoccus onubensis]|nr:Hint domain-containing protein [Paracoccus onubensis]